MSISSAFPVPPQKVFRPSKPTPNTFSEGTWRPRESAQPSHPPRDFRPAAQLAWQLGALLWHGLPWLPREELHDDHSLVLQLILQVLPRLGALAAWDSTTGLSVIPVLGPGVNRLLRWLADSHRGVHRHATPCPVDLSIEEEPENPETIGNQYLVLLLVPFSPGEVKNTKGNAFFYAKNYGEVLQIHINRRLG